MPSHPQTIAIAGGGLAGACAADELRRRGFDGRLILIGDEPDRPYERPPLSKEYLRGETTEIPFVHDEGFYADNSIELLTSTRVREIAPANREVVLGDDRRVGFDRLLIATGATPRRLQVPGADLDGIHHLRSVSDSRAIGERIERGERVVVVGSGWIGSEIAASARQRGCEVTVIEMASVPLQAVLGDQVGQIYLDIHREHGIEFIPETTVDRFEGTGSVERVITRDGAVLESEFVVVGVGVIPRVDEAAAAGIRTDNGILVDAGLRTSAESVFAAGDVANAEHPFYGRRLRVEHWANARAQGAAAAASMLGEEVAFDEIPYFFSDQYEVGMEYSGYATEWDRVVLRGDVAGREFIAFWLSNGRVVAGMNVNVWDVSDPIRDLIRSRRQINPELLADPDSPLADLAGEAVGGTR